MEQIKKMAKVQKGLKASPVRMAFLSISLTLLPACVTTVHIDKAAKEHQSKAAYDWRTDFSAARMRADVEFLADDRLEGRDTGSRGHEIAALYVAAEFKRLGLKPAGDNGSYFQQVPFERLALDMEQSFMDWTLDGKTTRLALGEDYSLSPAGGPALEVSGDLVFAGFGLHEPSLGYSDLEGLDLKNKIVVFFNGAPESFHSEIRAHYRSSSNKEKAIFDRGAAGILVLNTPTREARSSSEAVIKKLQAGNLDWVAKDRIETQAAPFVGSLSYKEARAIFAASGHDFDQTLEDYKNSSLKSHPLQGRLQAKRVSLVKERFTSPNVAAILEGQDEKLASEFAVTSAHLDHLGVSEEEGTEDHIHNGAMDNATGVATMLEVARNMVKNPRPRRSVLFVAVTAEEKGLLGAGYFAHYPTVAKDKIVSDVNLDMPVLLYNFVDVIAFGADRSSLGPITEKAIAKAGVALSPDPLPEQNIFVRSDHYRFVQQGIPSIFLMTGFGVTDEGDNGGEIFKDFLAHKYHSVEDQPSLPIRYDAGAKFAYVNYLILKDIANGNKRPAWNEGDYFGGLYSH